MIALKTYHGKKRVGMKKLIAAVIAFIALCTAAAVFLERKYLHTCTRRKRIGVTEESEKWIDKTPHEDTYMISRDGICLHGMIFDNGSDNWIVAVHGYDSELRGMADHAKRFHDAGYSVFMPDLRSFGTSGGTHTTMGHLEKNEVIDWINKLISERNAKNIVLYGISMGAATVMLTSGEKLPDNVRAVVEDCGYSSVHEEFEYNMMHTVHLPPYPVLWICDLITRCKTGWSLLNDGNCISAVKRTQIPILFIHGSSDTFVPFTMQEKLYNACGHPEKQKLVIKGAGHAEDSEKDPELYWKTVFEFVKKHIG